MQFQVQSVKGNIAIGTLENATAAEIMLKDLTEVEPFDFRI